jgi:hypothetical protein
MSESGGTTGKILTWIALAILMIVALKAAVWVVGATVGLAMTLLFTIGPILLLGWIVVKIFQHFGDKPA